MEPIGTQDERKPDSRVALVSFILDRGPASQVTRGTALLLPWLEFGPPPFNHWCPSC